MASIETCSYCGERGHSIQNCAKWKHLPELPETPPVLVKIEVGLVKKDTRLLEEAFNELNRMLSGPPLILEVHWRKRFGPNWDAFAGVEGKVILTINEKRIDRISFDELGVAFIHEIVHQKFPEALELETESKTEEYWKQLFPRIPFPSEAFEYWTTIRRWERRAGLEV